MSVWTGGNEPTAIMLLFATRRGVSVSITVHDPLSGSFVGVITDAAVMGDARVILHRLEPDGAEIFLGERVVAQRTALGQHVGPPLVGGHDLRTVGGQDRAIHPCI